MNYQALSLHLETIKRHFVVFHTVSMPADACREDLSAQKPNLRDLGWILDSSPTLRFFLHSHTNSVTLQMPPELTGTEQEEARNSDAITLGFVFFKLRHRTKLSTHFR